MLAVATRNEETSDILRNMQQSHLQSAELMKDADLTNKQGIYEHVLTSNENRFKIWALFESQKEVKYDEQMGKSAKPSD